MEEGIPELHYQQSVDEKRTWTETRRHLIQSIAATVKASPAYQQSMSYLETNKQSDV